MKGMSGLLNLGQTCYVNATIQSIRCLTDFVGIVRAEDPEEGSVRGCLCKLVESMNDSCLTFKPTTFVRKTSTIDFSINRPADAHEFLCYLINRLNDESKTKTTSETRLKDKRALEAFQKTFQNGISDIVPVFYGQLCTHVSSKQTKYKNEVFETFLTLNVPVKTNLYACLDEFFTTEQLTGDDRLLDETENKRVDATKKVYLWRNPRILIIVLNRFGEEKINDVVDIPDVLDVTRYKLSSSQNNVYRLRSVCNHVGDVGGGHYYTTAKWDGKWYTFDDTVINEITEVDGCAAYLLFYEIADKKNIKV